MELYDKEEILEKFLDYVNKSDDISIYKQRMEQHESLMRYCKGEKLKVREEYILSVIINEIEKNIFLENVKKNDRKVVTLQFQNIKSKEI